MHRTSRCSCTSVDVDQACNLNRVAFTHCLRIQMEKENMKHFLAFPSFRRLTCDERWQLNI